MDLLRLGCKCCSTAVDPVWIQSHTAIKTEEQPLDELVVKSYTYSVYGNAQ